MPTKAKKAVLSMAYSVLVFSSSSTVAAPPGYSQGSPLPPQMLVKPMPHQWAAIIHIRARDF
jgi:hypothetical protein